MNIHNNNNQRGGEVKRLAPCRLRQYNDDFPAAILCFDVFFIHGLFVVKYVLTFASYAMQVCKCKCSSVSATC